MKKSLLLLILITLSCNYAIAGEPDSTKVVLQKKHWIIPDALMAQYAGNVGNYAVGMEWDIWRDKLLFDFMYGWTPAYKTDASISAFTTKFTFLPKRFNLKKRFYLEPRIGMMLIWTTPNNETTWNRLPKTFPDGYYAPNAIRFAMNFGGQIGLKFDKCKRIKAVEFFAETTSNDLYFSYMINNRSVGITDIFSLALGFNIVFW